MLITSFTGNTQLDILKVLEKIIKKGKEKTSIAKLLQCLTLI